ncbi:MAG: MerR family DNA-binding protein [Mycobacterium sp.]
MDDDLHPTGLSVGQVADRMQIARSAVRWYADQDLLPCERITTNERRFFPDVLCRVAMIRASQRVGLSLDEIKQALAVLPPGAQPTHDDWDRLASRLREVIAERIDHLFILLDDLAPSPPGATTAQPSDPG